MKSLVDLILIPVTILGIALGLLTGLLQVGYDMGRELAKEIHDWTLR